MFRSSNFDKLLDKATSNLRLEPDWATNLQICDLIRQNDVTPKYALMAIKKKLYSPNPHQTMFALLVLESIVKNCGSGVHDEIASKTNCEMFRDIVKTSQHHNVRTKTLELIQAWAFAFRNSPKYRTVQDTVNIMKAEGYKFPALKESDAMFSADSAPEWFDGDVCHRCRVPFSLIQRKHHCRACGQVFCQQCSAKTTTLPKFGIEKEVRVCDSCFDQVSKPLGPGGPVKSESVDSTEYVTSTQPAGPPRKTEEELKEEEELQLAIALSQSEAEQKEKEKQRPQLISSAPPQQQTHNSPPSSTQLPYDELAKYLARNYWEQRAQPNAQSESPSAPISSPGPQQNTLAEVLSNKMNSLKLENGGGEDSELEEFITALKSQIEIFVNRMKSNSSRGRSIANDSSVQTLFMNITTMHSTLLKFIQHQDDNRVHFEGLQDKLTQVKDSRAALDVLREEHAERLRRAAEQAERQRQLQMAHKLDIMRKKKQEYLQYQRQLALQRVQEQEREMQMRQEQQKHQYMMGGPGAFYMQGSPVHQFHNQQPSYQQPQFNQGYQMMPNMHQPQQVHPESPNMMHPQNNQMGQPGTLPRQGQGQPGHPMPPLNMQHGTVNQGTPMPQGGQMPLNQHMPQIPGGMPPPGPMLRPGGPMVQNPALGMVNQVGPQSAGLPNQNNQPMQQPPRMGQNMQNNSQMPQPNIGQPPNQIPNSIPSQGQQIQQNINQSRQVGPQVNQSMPPHMNSHMGQQPLNQAQIMQGHQMPPNMKTEVQNPAQPPINDIQNTPNQRDTLSPSNSINPIPPPTNAVPPSSPQQVNVAQDNATAELISFD